MKFETTPAFYSDYRRLKRERDVSRSVRETTKDESMTKDTTAPLGIRLARTDDPAEVDRLYDICLRTGAGGAGAEDLHDDPRLLGEVYLGAYLEYEPELAFVLTSNDDTALGYVLGARDTVAFEKLLESDWWPRLRKQYPLGSFPEGSHDERLVEMIHHPKHTDPDVIDGFPAHLHINILAEGRGGGSGRRLLETLFAALRDRGVAGVHLGVAPQNTNAIGFYRHLGFQHLDGNLYALTF